MAIDPTMFGAGPAAPDAALGTPPMGMPMGVPPMGAPAPAEAVMQAVMGLVPQQQQAMQGMTMQVQDAVMAALAGAPNPLGLGAVTGPVAPGALEGAVPDGAAEGEGEVY